MFDDLSGAEMFFLLCAIVGGGLFVLRSVSLFAGLGGDDMADSAADVADADGAPVDDFKMMSVHSLTAFLLMFGLVGFLILRSRGPDSAVLAAAASFLSGLATMFVIARLFSASRKLQSDGTIYPKDAIGADGSVYLEIRPGSIGKVQINVNGALKVFDARAKAASAFLATGTHIKVVEAGEVLVVETCQ
jgi:hypothetical protein